MGRSFAFVALLLLTSFPAQAQQPETASTAAPIDLNGYLARLDEWSAATERLKDHPEEAAVLEKQLPQAWPVVIAGQHYVVSTDWLRKTLVSLEVNHWLAGDYSKEIQIHLQVMRAQAESLAQAPSASPSLAQGKLEEILSRREFRGVHGPSWLDRLRERASALLLNVLERLLSRLRGHPVAGKVLLWSLVVAPLLALLFWVVRFLASRPLGVTLKLPEPVSTPTNWQALARQALAAAARGNYRDSIRLAYWAGVYRFEELGVWQVDRTRTHREYLRLLPESHPDRAPLAAITSRFERVWYGGQAASSDDFRFTLAELERLGCVFPSNPATARS